MLAHITSSPIVLFSVALICIIDFANLRYFRHGSDAVLILVLGSGCCGKSGNKREMD